MEDEDELYYARSIYDTDEDDEEIAFDHRTFHFGKTEWSKAQDVHSLALADLTYLFGTLNERINTHPHLKDFIIRKEVNDLLWLTGTRIGEDRLNRVIALNIGMISDDSLEVAKAVWCAKAFSTNLVPLQDDIRDVLGRYRVEQKSLALMHRPIGQEFDDLYEEWAEKIAEKGALLHPFTKAALGFFVWQAIEASGSDELDAAIVCQKLAAAEYTSTLGFLPIALGGQGAFKRAGTVEEKLGRWFTVAANACQRGLLETNRVLTFEQKAREVFNSRLFESVLDVIIRSPIVSVEMITNRHKIDKSTAHRYLVKLENEGLLSEITGSQRFKFWKIK